MIGSGRHKAEFGQKRSVCLSEKFRFTYTYTSRFFRMSRIKLELVKAINLSLRYVTYL